MKALQKPVPTTTRLLAALFSMTLAVPVLAIPTEGKPRTAANKKTVVQATAKRPSATTRAAAAPAPASPRSAAEVAPQNPVMAAPQVAERATPIQPGMAAAATPVAVAPSAAVAAVATPAAAAPVPAAAPQNPYLAGWYRPVPAAALPAMAVGQLNDNARYVSDAVTSIPAKVADALPSIKTVHPTGGRDLVVANLKCPVEMVTGQYFIPANAMREGINGLFNKLNDSQLLKFDIQLVCS